MTDTGGTTCPNCGAVMPDDSEACSHCGTILHDVPAAEPAPMPQPAAMAPELASLAPPPLPTIEPPGSSAGRVVSVTRTVKTNINLRLPQEAVDKQHWLTSDQWQRLLDAYEQQLAARMKADVEAGRTPDVAAESAALPVPWDQVGDTLTPAQRQEIERGLRQLLGSVGGASTQESARSVLVVKTPSIRIKATDGCGALALMAILLALGLLAYILAH